jgi:hypothetical protein
MDLSSGNALAHPSLYFTQARDHFKIIVVLKSPLIWLFFFVIAGKCLFQDWMHFVGR